MPGTGSPVAQPISVPEVRQSGAVVGHMERTFGSFVLLGPLGGTVIPPSPIELPTANLSASPSSLPVGGGQVTVGYSSTGATSGTITPIIGAVTLPSGTRSVMVTSSTTFVGSFTNSAGTTTRSVSVSVASTPLPPQPTVCNYDSVASFWFAVGARSVQRDTVYIPGADSLQIDWKVWWKKGTTSKVNSRSVKLK